MYFGSRVLTPHEVDSFEERGNQILPLELLAAACVYESIPDVLRDAEVIHFIDNSAALSNCIKGSAKRDDCARIVCSLHLAVAKARVVPWFAYVASDANVSDLPSRGYISEMHAIFEAAFPGSSASAEHRQTIFPSRLPWSQMSSEAIALPPMATARPTRRGGRKHKRQP